MATAGRARHRPRLGETAPCSPVRLRSLGVLGRPGEPAAVRSALQHLRHEPAGQLELRSPGPSWGVSLAVRLNQIRSSRTRSDIRGVRPEPDRAAGGSSPRPLRDRAGHRRPTPELEDSEAEDRQVSTPPTEVIDADPLAGRPPGVDARTGATSRPATLRLVRRPPGARAGLDRHARRGVTALIGPSGCGKSTFLRLLNRMHELVPSASLAGEVLLDGEDIYRPGSAGPARCACASAWCSRSRTRSRP